MRIGDAAAAAGTTPRALRFYEERGLLPPPPRTATGQREYGARDIARIGVVRELLALGLTVEDVRGCAGHLETLLDAPLPQRCGVPADVGEGGGSAGVAARRLAAIDAEIARLTLLRERLAARVAVPSADAPDRENPVGGAVTAPPSIRS
ncbi:MerR family transcriptional regulator [Streptomyces sp. NBC_00654]|uniref:MerR family transcriptional regulator n=1 Tax=Streptomyces sp. NBC_00654 TaxID=2975799 RepID=UPI0022569D95|nr:MerR family transcriptional regulator [Streptomyces sp. NBC_00654]MCX4967869.1 MerR family transcriptional regulator [Streptomyces sp. NBC_00654]